MTEYRVEGTLSGKQPPTFNTFTMADDRRDGVAIPHVNPLNSHEDLAPSTAVDTIKEANPQADILPGDSATTKAEKVERHGARSNGDV